MHFSRILDFWFRRNGDKLALSCENDTLSWAELDRASASLAAWLREAGLKPGDRFGCLMTNNLPWCVGYVASLRLGTIFVPLNAMFGSFELRQIEGDADCAMILSTPSQIGKLGIHDGHPQVDEPRLYDRRSQAAATSYADIVSTPREFISADLSDDEVMAICYTSGTTGVPKGATLTHRNIDAAMQGLILGFGLRGGEERSLILAPLGFTGGVISALTPVLAVGGSAWIEKTVDPNRALRLLVDHRITIFGGVPALWERVALAPGFAEADLSAINAAFTGGAPVPRPLLETFLAKGVCIRQQYGFTEGSGGVSAPDKAAAVARPTACGFPLPGIELVIRNDRRQRVAVGEVGEVQARGPQLMQGYWNRPEATADAFIGEWYKTGDLATYDEHGAIVVVDRKKNMLISGGVNIYPAEVERAMASIKGIAEVVVLGIPSEKWGQEVAAVIYAPTLGDADSIMSQARALLGSYKAPKHIRLSPEPLPKTASNKIARTGLLELFERVPSASTQAA